MNRSGLASLCALLMLAACDMGLTSFVDDDSDDDAEEEDEDDDGDDWQGTGGLGGGEGAGCEDLDGDGVDTCEGDCDDEDPNVSPLEEEIPFDGIDNDCDGEDAGDVIVASGEGGLSIDDDSTTESAAGVSGCGTVVDLQVTVDINHTYRGDLVVELEAPDGTRVVLHDREGGMSADLQGTYAITGGSLSPAESLDRFLDLSGDGEWRLIVSDELFGDQGVLNGWSMTLWCID